MIKMKITEEQKLKAFIKEVDRYRINHQNINFFYDDIMSLKIFSLQDFSYEKDQQLFNEISFILSIITSIITHPHLANKGEDVLLRTSQAGHISTESFQRVFKEAKLWKEKDFVMVPEYVYHYQYSDEIKIYENIFIGMLINFIDNKISQYKSFYIDLIPMFQEHDTKILENVMVSEALKKLDQIKKRITHLKNTNFYKEISSCNLNLKKIVPTNILLKDQLYRFCYQFYLKYVHYDDHQILTNDLKIYYFCLFLQILKEKGYQCKNIDLIKKNFYEIMLQNEKFNIQIKSPKKGAFLQFSISYQNNKKIAIHKLFLVEEKQNIERLINDVNFDNNITTKEIMTIWNLYYFENYFYEFDILI